MSKSKLGRWIGFFFALLVVVGLLMNTVKDSIVKGPPNVVEGYEPWDEELVEEFASLPVQDGGRVKPMSTWAGFELLAINGKRKVRFETDGDKVKLTPTEWMLDAMFREGVANEMAVFQVEDANVLDLIGVDHSNKKRRDRYSFKDLQPYLAEFDRVRTDLVKKKQDEIELDLIEEQFLGLDTNIRSYIELTSHFSPVRSRMADKDSSLTDELQKFSSWVKRWRQLAPLFASSAQQSPDGADGLKAVATNIAIRVGDSVYSEIAMMPSLDKENPTWPKRNNWLMEYMQFKADADEDQLEYLTEMESLALAYEEGGQKGLLEAVKAYKTKVYDLMEERGEGATLEGEMAYYRMDYFYRSLTPFVLGFLVVSFGWISPATRWGRVCNRIGWVLLIIGTLLVVAGITHRSILMGRPPVGNLYDTIPFITAIAIIVLGFIEWVTKRGVCLGLAFFLAALGMFLAMWYEESKGVDPMNPLIAVLRSNFWLATHVTTITIGYAGGLLTAGLSHVYIFARIFNIDEGDKSFRRFMTRIVYGGVCFTLFFSLVGTILGGVWANDSWGRFWGWDPKENGALIIVLWTLIILHARMAGYIKEWGIHICAVFGSILVTFSWWHVNFLSVGLHNYGFTAGDGLKAIWSFYALEVLVIVLGISFAWYENAKKKQLKSA
ncbi:cytochrome c biogenesis protein [Rubritalea spongiae]|uniref:Cytochrome c biogenesis protein n=1 Tax=Rubritalea spongiae TaxID=430797 RepID=A0ABW5E505_9BACT